MNSDDPMHTTIAPAPAGTAWTICGITCKAVTRETKIKSKQEGVKRNRRARGQTGASAPREMFTKREASGLLSFPKPNVMKIKDKMEGLKKM